MAKMTDKEKQDWDTLYNYVKKILGYDDTMALPKFAVMRLKGLADGKYYANKKTKTMAQYDYNTIYLTFIFCKDKIQQALQTKSFANEQAKFNYVFAIVNNNINDVVLRLKKAKKTEKIVKQQIEKVEIDMPIVTNEQNNTTQKYTFEEELNSKFNDLTKEMW